MEVVVYGKPDCPFCVKAKDILDNKNISYTYIDIVKNPSEKEFLLEKGLKTVPQIFVNGEYHGESDSAESVGDDSETIAEPVTEVIKSDGSVVKFNPDKLNNKARWGAQRKVNWSNVVLKALKRLHNRCTTKDINQALINTCVEEFDEKHFLLAGRILAGVVYKEAFGGFTKIPTLKEHHDKMSVLGYWENLPYSEEEFDKLNDVMYHSKDLDYSYPEIKQISDKYVIRNRVKNIALESPQFMYMGMAMATMKGMPSGRRVEDVIKLYTYLSDKKICAPTPFMAKLRTPDRGFASCSVHTTDDTIDSLAAGDHISYIMTAASAGIGSHIKTRSKGDEVRGGVTIHQGKRSYYKALESNVAANLQGGRGGSATVHCNVLDPEIEDIITWKSKKTASKIRVDGIHYSVGFNGAFARKVRDNEDWLLASYKDEPDLYESMYEGDQSNFEKLYSEAESKGKYKKINARKLALDVLIQGQESGQVYLHRTDEMNRHTPFKDKIYSSNLCVAPETQILTDKGYIPIAELENETVNVWNGEQFSETVVKKTGENQKLVRVVTSSGQELECTPYHKFYVFDGYHKPCIEKRAHELVEGDKLAKFDLPVIEGDKELSLAWQNGFYTADGYCDKSGNARVYLYHEKRKLREHFKFKKLFVKEDTNREYGTVEGLKDKFFVPSEDYTIQARLNWFAGWVDGDGCVYRNGTNQQLVGSSVEKEFLLETQRMLQTLGVSAKILPMYDEGFRSLPKNDGTGDHKDYWCRESWRLVVTSCDLHKLMVLGLGDHLKRLEVVKRLPQRDAKQFVKVMSVTDEGRKDDTYCFSEKLRGMGMFNGILTGQCQEIALPTKPFKDVTQLYTEGSAEDAEIGLCSLGATVIRRIKSDEEYKDVMYYIALMIDNVIDIMDYPFPNLKATAQARRSLGIGVTDLAGYMAEKKLKYSSSEGKKHMHKLAERHMFYAIEASLRLAKEKGNNIWSHKTKWKDGWLPIDTMNPNVYKVVGQELERNWEDLRTRVVAQGGIRNSVNCCAMPNESSSIATNGTNSILPARSIKTIKTNANKKTRFLVPNADTHAEHYELAWDISGRNMIDTYAIWTCFMDQTISADEYLDFTKGDITSKELLDRFLYMAAMGVKTRYYTNSKTNSGSDLLSKKEPEIVEDTGCAGGGCAL